MITVNGPEEQKVDSTPSAIPLRESFESPSDRPETDVTTELPPVDDDDNYQAPESD
jgi:hypothetical protein